MTFRKTKGLLFVALCLSPASAVSDDLCEKYANGFDTANKKMAQLAVDGLGDNSAPRASLNQMRRLDWRMFQLILIHQMRAQDCDIPKALSGGDPYMTEALKCANKKLERKYDAPECNMAKWER